MKKFIDRNGQIVKVGTNIRLAGLIGTVNALPIEGQRNYEVMFWGENGRRIEAHLPLGSFPMLQIEVEEPTISRDAANVLFQFLQEKGVTASGFCSPIEEKILSMIHPDESPRQPIKPAPSPYQDLGM